MPPEPSVLGYFVYLLFIFLPGLGFGELLNLWRRDEGLMERVGLALGLGLAVDTVVLMVKTSGFSAFGLVLRGMDVETVYFVILVGLAASALSLVIRRRFAFPVRPKTADLLLLLIMATVGSLLLLYFQKYPIFPEYLSADFSNHVQFTQNLIAGTATSIPAGVLYYGVHFQLASSLLLAGGEPLVTLRWTMALLVMLSPSLFYLAASRLFSNKGAALVAAAIFFFSGTVWFVSVFDSGLYPNYFGILVSLFLIAVVIDLARNIRSSLTWVAFVLVLVTAYFSHYSTITLLPALFVLPLVKVLKKSDAVPYLVPAAVSVAPAAIAALAFPSLPSRVLTLASAGGGNLTGSTPLTSALAGWPVLSYMAVEVYSDVAFAFLFLLACVFVYLLTRSGNVLLFLPLAWFFSLVLASPFNVSAWRFSFEALVPLVLMAGYSIYSVLPKLKIHGKGRTSGHWKIAVVLVLLLSPILVGSWGQTVVTDSLSNSQSFASAQQNIYNALFWLKDNTSSTSRYLSVSDFRFSYSSLLFGRTTYYDYFAQPSEAISAARQVGANYIIVTYLVTVSLPPDPSLFPWNNFNQSANLTLLYSNGDVRIFQVHP